MAVAELFAGLVRDAPSLVIAMGTLVISFQPPGAKDLMVGLFGTNDKLALNVLIVGAAVAIAAVAGLLAARRFSMGVAVFVCFGLVAAIAAVRQPLVSRPLGLVNAALAVAVGLIVLRGLLALAGRGWGRDLPPPVMPVGASMRRVASADRRRLLRGALAGVPGVPRPSGHPGRPRPGPADQRPTGHAGGSSSPAPAPWGPSSSPGESVGCSSIDRPSRGSSAPRGSPRPLEAVPPLAADQALAVPGLTPLVVPNDDFYRIDTTLFVPQVDVETWKLQVKGMVDQPLTLHLRRAPGDAPLRAVRDDRLRQQQGRRTTSSGNALWTGVRLKDVLDAAGVQAGATQIVGRSVDDFTVGFPTSWAMAPEREPMIAVGMNREPLPAAHGFPARLIVPGLYGYVSATKWLASIELTTREAVDGYWVPLGWAKDAPILTQSRIDAPGSGANLAAGATSRSPASPGPRIAGSPGRGPHRRRRLAGRPDQPADLRSRPGSSGRCPGRPRPGAQHRGPGDRRHRRGPDGRGHRPAPDGARGHHRIFVTVG